jgi:iron complex transport system permease protein
MRPSRPFLIFPLLFVLTLASLAAALMAGSLSVSPRALLAALVGNTPDGDLTAQVLWQLRLPRALSGFAVGGLLALAGTLMQTLLRNPLADPYVLGISGGAGVGALTALFLGLAGFWLSGAAFGGALAAILLVFALARGNMSGAQTRLLLTGVVVASGCGAVIALLLAIAPETRLRGMLFWLMGDLGSADAPWASLAALAVALALSFPFARELNLLARNPEVAQTQGVDVPKLRGLVYFIAALATACAVVAAGSIGFIGLIVPHLVRIALGSDLRLVLPAAALAGGALLTAADTLARTLIAPEQLPVGVLTALIGVPLFLFLLARTGRRG